MINTSSTISLLKQDEIVKQGCPMQQQSQNMAKISKSYILTPPILRSLGCQKCEKPLHELTVHIWLLYHHPNFKYHTLCKWDGINYIQNGQRDNHKDKVVNINIFIAIGTRHVMNLQSKFSYCIITQTLNIALCL